MRSRITVDKNRLSRARQGANSAIRLVTTWQVQVAFQSIPWYLGKPLRPPLWDTTVTPEENRSFFTRRVQKTEQRHALCNGEPDAEEIYVWFQIFRLEFSVCLFAF